MHKCHLPSGSFFPTIGCIALEQGTGEGMSRRKTISIILMIVGAAILLGTVVFAVDKATSTDPSGLGTSIVTILGLLLGAITEIKGLKDWNKKEPPTQEIRNTAINGGQVNTAPEGRNIQVANSGQYYEQNIQASNNSNTLGNITVGDGATVSLNIGNTGSSPLKTPNILHQLPQQPADFTGRKELIEQLIEDFNTHKGATITGKSMYGLTGMGGIGKTALGLVVAHEVAKDYPDA